MVKGETVLRALQRVEKRAERASDAQLLDTYVETGAVFESLRYTDNALLFGRRGTGKTHALKYLAQHVRRAGDLAIYVDMDRLGSTGGLYSNPEVTLAQRATRLLVDTLNEIHDKLVDAALELDVDAAVLDACDELARSVNEVVVQGTVERETEAGGEREATSSAGLSLGPTSFELTASSGDRSTARYAHRARETGTASHRVHLGAAATWIERLVNGLPVNRVWVLLDEWSAVPLDLQPLLADMLRRSLLSVHKVTVKIAAIAHRSYFVDYTTDGYVGVELGADIFASLDLDEFVVFPSRSNAEREERATSFFRELLYKHVQAILRESNEGQLDSPQQLAATAFTQVHALRELVRAAEGVPRDALSIAARAALRVPEGGSVSTDDIRDAAEILFQQVKSSALNAYPPARALLTRILDEVIGGKHARAFLLEQSDTAHPLIQQLVDSRILHIIKKGYSGQDEPGVRFDVLQIDYGCYVDLLKTSHAPSSLLGLPGGCGSTDRASYRALYQGVQVPEDDYRAIRRAILRLGEILSAIGYEDPAAG
jgi:hypothetical protein